MTGAPVEELRRIAIKDGMRTLRMDGVMKIFKGQVDLERARRVCIE
jgi:type II secretory ATPase GspE/PulE/Tfp pilus assembly ATPase PilB-like protein